MDRFAELRRLRAEGKTKRDFSFDEEDNRIYDEVGEAEYEKRQRERLREDDFVIDDDGKGYVDNGEYEWDQPTNYSDEEEEESGSAKKRKHKGAREEEPSKHKDIVSLFRTQKKPKTSGASGSVSAPSHAPKVDVDAIVNGLGAARTPKNSKNTLKPTGSSSIGSKSSLGSRSILGSGLGSRSSLGSGLGSNKFGSLGRSSKFSTPSSASRGLDTPTRNRLGPREDDSSFDQQYDEGDSSMLGGEILNNNNHDDNNDDEESIKTEEVKTEIKPEPEMEYKSEEPSSEPPSFSMVPVALSAGAEASDSDDDLMDIFSSKHNSEAANSSAPNSSAPNSDASHNYLPEAPMSDPPLPTSSPSPGMSSVVELEQEFLPTPHASSEEAITGSYASNAWNLISDDAEEQTQKIVASANDKLPETFRFYWSDYIDMQGGLILFGKSEQGVGSTVFVYGVERDVYVLPKEGVSTDEVAAEVREFFFQHGVERLRSKKTTLRDVFAKDKSEKEYLHVKAPYSLTLPLPDQGKTYTSVHGMNSSRIENFLIGKNVMGPCWLDVKVQRISSGTTWSGIAFDCASPAHVKVVNSSEVPKLTIMSIAVTTVPNAKLEHELVSISLRVFRNIDQGAHDATKIPSMLISGIRPPTSGVFPLGFKQAINEHNASRGSGKQVLETFSNEQKLLSWFFSVLKQQDPDALVGHNLTNIHLATILERALAHNLPNWSQLGRFKMSRKPTSVKTMEVQRVCSGRLLVDLKNTFGEEIASSKCTDYSLEEMCRVFLGQQRLPFDTNLASGNWLEQGTSGLVEIVRRSEYDTLFVTSIALKNQMLPLSRQLTCLAGNPWRATLAGTRSGRNDYLLMHEFTKHGFLIPEKRNKAAQDKTPGSYTGGHVFDPVAGLHQSCVLVMDFNSLYPSIIQEYNICLTTVNFERDQSESPEVPASNVHQGLLPKILQNLVERRREVKNLMKSDSASAAQQAEWNIRQTALKLTANSMYGCLGFADSRFCAKPLAQLITQKGREALLRTRDLAVEKGLEVLYGDTDSVMINTNALTYADAFAIGVDFKKAVNKQYRLMEIDIDHIFRKLLLYLKKKYAAVILQPDGGLKLEYKGLDMRRREFSDVCKVSSTKVLQIIFGLDEATLKHEKEEVDAGKNATQVSQDVSDPIEIFSKVYEFCHEYAVRVREGKVSPKMFVMRNQLSKELSQYNTYDKPQLVVAAARVEAGYSVRAKDVINYIITKDMNNENRPFPQRAVAPEELGRRKLTPDYEWYLQNQVFVPINRFCEKIEGFDSVQLAEAMELQNAEELKQVVKRSEGQKSNLYDGLPLVTLLQDSQRFAQCDKLELEYAGNLFTYEGVQQLQSEGIIEPKSARTVPFTEVAQQVDNTIRGYISKYYQNWLVCDDCKGLTRLPSAYSSRSCPHKHCTGSLHLQYSSQELYTQMCYIASLFDITRARTKTASAIVQGRNSEGLKLVESVAQKYINRSGYNFVNIGQYFV